MSTPETPQAPAQEPAKPAPPAGQVQPAPTPPPTPEPAQEPDWKAEARKWEARAKENSEAARRLAEIEVAEQSNLSELEKATRRAESAEKALAAKEAEALRLAVASKHGISGDYLDLLTGDGEAELTAKAEKVAALIKAKSDASAGPYVPSEGVRPSGATKTPADLFAQAVGEAL